MKNYAQLNQENICVGISSLSNEVDEYNYATNVNYNPITGAYTRETVFVSRMIEVPVYSDNFIGLVYDDGSWKAQ